MRTYPKDDDSAAYHRWLDCQWDEAKIRRHQDDIDELRWQEHERRRLESDNAACGYEPEGKANDSDEK
jgi:hypothetical protein